MMCMDIESQVWRQAVKPTINFHAIHDQRVSSLDRLFCSAIQLAGNNRVLRNDLWALRLSVLQTVLPIGSNDVGLAEAITRVMSSHELGTLRANFETALELIRGAGENRKRELLDNLYCESNEQILVWNRPWNRAPFGWPSGIQDVLGDEYGDGVRLISGIRDLPDVGKQLVLVSPLQGNRFPLANAVKLLRPGRWQEIHVLRYDVAIESDQFTRDAMYSPGALQYWCVDLKVADSMIGNSSHSEVSDDGIAAEPMDDANDLDFGSIFGDVGSGIAEPIGACLVELSSGFCTAYANDHQVRLLNGDQWIQVLNLKEGDLIPVAVDAGDRQTLEEMATTRLGQANVTLVRKRIGAWKQVIRTCINRHGEDKLRREFQKRGAGKNPTWREDAWSAETPWAPRSKHDFAALIRSANDLGFFLGEDVEQFIAQGWRDVQLLRSAHRLAGRDLVSQLEDELERKLQGESSEWNAGDEVSLDDGGRKYVVCEVTFVRDAGQLYPCQLGRLVKWQG